MNIYDIEGKIAYAVFSFFGFFLNMGGPNVYRNFLFFIKHGNPDFIENFWAYVKCRNSSIYKNFAHISSIGLQVFIEIF